MDSPNATPEDRKVASSDVRKDWSEILHHVRHTGGRVEILLHGKPVAVLVHPEDLRILEAVDTAWESHLAAEAVKGDDGVRIPHEQVLRELGLDQAPTTPAGKAIVDRIVEAASTAKTSGRTDPFKGFSLVIDKGDFESYPKARPFARAHSADHPKRRTGKQDTRAAAKVRKGLARDVGGRLRDRKSSMKPGTIRRVDL